MKEPVSATADAVTEVAKTAGKIVDVVHDTGRWFDGRTSEALDHAIGWAFTDHLRRSRAIREAKHIERMQILALGTQRRLEDLGADRLHPVAETTAVPLIDAAALEDQPELQALWANLLATALTQEEEDLRNFVSILRELRSVDAAALADYYGRLPDAVKPPWREEGYEHEAGSMDGDLYGVEVARNLFRLGLVEPATIKVRLVNRVRDGGYGLSVEVEDATISLPGDLYRIQMTSTGREFCAAVGMQGEATA